MATHTLPEAETPLGKVGRVTGHIIPGRKSSGEVTITILGGSESFLARAENPKDELFVGEEVNIVDFIAPKTVYVERA